VIIWVVVMLPVWFLMRRRPEDMGLVPDGEPTDKGYVNVASPKNPPQESREELNFTLRQALGTRAFWLLAIFSITFNFPLIGMFLNLPAFFSDSGFSAAMAASAMGVYAFSTFMARLFWGLMTERFDVRGLFTILAFAASGFLGLILMMSFFDFMVLAWVLFPLAAAMGFLGGGSTILRSILWPNYFGRFHIGSIRGLAYPFEAVASATGPVFAAFVFDSTGSYQISFSLFVGMFFVAGFLMLAAKPPVIEPS